MGNRAIVQCFINHEAKLDIQNNNGNTALHMAACHTHNLVVEQLAIAGAPLDVANKVIFIQTRYNHVIIIIPEQSEGCESVPIELFVRVCIVAKGADLAHFNQLFLQVGASLGCQTLRRLGTCQVLPRRGQLMPVLWQVRA